MKRICEELQQSADRTDALQLEMCNHRNDLEDNNCDDVEKSLRRLLGKGLKLNNVRGGEKKQLLYYSPPTNVHTDQHGKSEGKEGGGQMGDEVDEKQDVGLKKNISEIVEDSITKLEYVLNLVRRAD